MTHPLAHLVHVPRVINPDQQCSGCALVFLPSELDGGLCPKCAAGEHEPTPEWAARACFAFMSIGEHEIAADHLTRLIQMLPEHAAALAPVIALVRAGDPGVMDHPSIQIATTLSARFGS